MALLAPDAQLHRFSDRPSANNTVPNSIGREELLTPEEFRSDQTALGLRQRARRDVGGLFAPQPSEPRPIREGSDVASAHPANAELLFIALFGQSTIDGGPDGVLTLLGGDLCASVVVGFLRDHIAHELAISIAWARGISKRPREPVTTPTTRAARKDFANMIGS